jgi:hypothetical protein
MITIHHYQQFGLLVAMSNDPYLKEKYTRLDKEFSDMTNFSIDRVLQEEYLFKLERLPYQIRLYPSDETSENAFNAKYSELLNKMEAEYQESLEKYKTGGHVHIPCPF